MKKFHKTLDFIIFAIGSLCLLYFLYLSFVYGFFSISFSWTFLLIGCVLIALSSYELNKKAHILHHFSKITQRIILSFLCFGIIFFVAVEGYIIYKGTLQSTKSLTTAIVLGAQLNGNKISRLLRYRLDAAIEFSKEYPDSSIIVSGGQGEGESVSEASAMKDYLVKHGVDEKRILIEERSTNTQENLEYSMLLPYASSKALPSNDVTIITNSFHMARAMYIANTFRMKQNCYSYPAKTDLDLAPVFYFREFFAFCKDILTT